MGELKKKQKKQDSYCLSSVDIMTNFFTGMSFTFYQSYGFVSTGLVVMATKF